MMLSTNTRQGLLNLGMIPLGKHTVADWASKGLEVSEEALIEVDLAGTGTAGYAVSINRHQIVANHQNVPDWFIREHEASLAGLDNPAHKEAFAQGALSAVKPPSTTGLIPAAYQAVAGYR